MAESGPEIVDEIERYLRTGDSDPHHAAWPGSFLEREVSAHRDLRSALIRAVRQLTKGVAHRSIPDVDVVSLTRARVGPMVRGLFPRSEQDAVLAKIERSVVFVTSANVEKLLLEQAFDGSAWTLANMYLASLGAELLGNDAPHLVGISEETTCHVSAEYFVEDDPFADFIVHETAHIFHNCKRTTIGLPETRSREWLLDIEFRKRETFAYACEAYACVLRRGKDPVERRALVDEYGRQARIADDRASTAEVTDLVRAAAEARNGWKVILASCAPVRPSLRAPRTLAQ